MKLLIEHANVTVASIEEAKKFLGTAFPDFSVRGGGYLHDNAKLGDWIHFGNEETYIALQQNRKHSEHIGTKYTNDGINHLGFVIDDVEDLIRRMRMNGYVPTPNYVIDDNPHRRRAYFFDGNGFEWEFVEYLSETATERNDYST